MNIINMVKKYQKKKAKKAAKEELKQMIPTLRGQLNEVTSGLDELNGDWQMIFGLNTLPSYQRQGYAAKIMCAMIDLARQEKRKGLVLTCKDRLVPYYSQFGFKNEGVSLSVHGGVVWYQMRLEF